MKGKIVAIGDYGVLVELAHGIKGLVTPQHLGDTLLSQASIEKKFQVGAALS